MPIDRWMDKETVVYTHSEILFCLKQEGNPAICNKMDETGAHNAIWNKPIIEGQTMHDYAYMRYIKQSNS